MKSFILAFMMVLALFTCPALAMDTPSVDMNVNVMNTHIWRGLELSHEQFTLNPNLSVMLNPFNVSNGQLRFSYEGYINNTGRNVKDLYFNRFGVDYTLSDIYHGLYASLGYNYFNVNNLTIPDDFQEVMGEIGWKWDVSSVFSVTPYYRANWKVTGDNGWYHEIGLNTKLGNRLLYVSLNGKVSYLDDENGYSEWHDGSVRVSVRWNFVNNQHMNIYLEPWTEYIYALSDNAKTYMMANSENSDDSFWTFGAMIGMSF